MTIELIKLFSCYIGLFVVGLMMFNSIFNNFSVIFLWWSVLLMEGTGGHGENHRPVASYLQTLSHNVVHFALSDQDSNSQHQW